MLPHKHDDGQSWSVAVQPNYDPVQSLPHKHRESSHVFTDLMVAQLSW